MDIKFKEEVLIAELFRHLCPDFPNGKLNKSESPDFILNNGPKKKIGIEITKLMDRNRNEERFAAAEADELKNLIILNSRDIFEYNSGLDLHVSFLFNSEVHIRHSKVMPYSALVSEYLINAVRGRKTGDIFHLYIKNPEKLDFLNALSIFNHPLLKNFEWELTDAYQLSRLNEEEILRIVREKEDKLPIYRKKMLDEYWLLISTDINGNGLSANINRIVDRISLSTEYNRIFLLERTRGKLHELNVGFG